MFIMIISTVFHYRDDDEKGSLTGSKPESETDSMAEYGDTDPGRFTEDGSFIGTVSSRCNFLPSDQQLPAVKVVAVRGRCRAMHWGVLREHRLSEKRRRDRHRRRSEPLLPATSPFLPRVRLVGAIGAATPPLMPRSSASTPMLRRLGSRRFSSATATPLMQRDVERFLTDKQSADGKENDKDEEATNLDKGDGVESEATSGSVYVSCDDGRCSTDTDSSEMTIASSSIGFRFDSLVEPLLPPTETDL